jgi:hypothetical protein
MRATEVVANSAVTPTRNGGDTNNHTERTTPMTTAAAPHSSLFMALELSKRNWKLAFSNGEKIRQSLS